jgi:hypothetical protein
MSIGSSSISETPIAAQDNLNSNKTPPGQTPLTDPTASSDPVVPTEPAAPSDPTAGN